MLVVRILEDAPEGMFWLPIMVSERIEADLMADRYTFDAVDVWIETPIASICVRTNYIEDFNPDRFAEIISGTGNQTSKRSV